MKKVLQLIVLSILCFIHFHIQAQISITFINVVQPCSNNGSATASVTGGTMPYKYIWVNPYGDTISTSNSISNVFHGDYYVTVSDFNNQQTFEYLSLPGVVHFINDTISQAAVSRLGINVTATCPIYIGTLTDSIIGTNPPYTYSLIPGSTQTVSTTFSTFNNLPLGNYTCIVTNSIGCADTVSVYVLGSPGYYVKTPTTPDTCTSNGTAKALPTGGGTAPFTYLWNTSPVQTTQTITGLPATDNSSTQLYVTLTDSNGCVAMGYPYVQNVISPYSMQSFATVQDAICGQSLGSISISNSGGAPPYTYAWSNGATTKAINNLSAGTYNLLVTDAGGCHENFTKYIYSYSPVYVNYSTTKANCANTGGSVQAYAGGGLAPYTYQWSNGQTTSGISNLSSGWYGVIATDVNGCSSGIEAYVDYQPNCIAIINGQVINDMNGNCVFDLNESGLPQQVINVNGKLDYSDWNGNYSIRLVNPSGTSAISQKTINPWNQVCPGSSITLTPVGGSTYNGNDFYDKPTPLTTDLEVYISTDSCRPGFTFNQWLTVFNRGTSTMTGYVTLQPNPLLTIISPGNATSYNSSTNTFTFNFHNLAPMTWVSFYLNLQAPIGTSLFTPLTSYAVAYPLNGDVTPSNNYDTLNYRVTGSYDPNEKSVTPKGTGAAGNISTADETLTYTIHFQNTGSYQTNTVSIIDTIDANLDIYSLKVTGSFPGIYSYDLPVISFTSNNVIKFSFNRCYLQPATSDIANSSGFITYTIKQKNNLSIGTQIKNTAAIYFDYNSPIITNTTVNTISSTTGIQSYDNKNNNSVQVYPNPFDGNTTFIIQTKNLNGNYSFQLFDVLGKQVKSINEITTKQFQVSREGLPNGIYFYKIYNAATIIGIGKLVIQ